MADPDEHGGLPDESARPPVDGLASAELASWSTPSARSSSRWRSSARRASARRDAGRERRLLGRRGQRRARQLARLRGRLRADPGAGPSLGVRGRGRRPDDRARRRASGATPTPSTPRRSAPRRPTARSRCSARASRRAGAARSCSTPTWRPRSLASSARCCPPTPSSADARSSPAGGRRDRRRRARARRRRHRPEGLASAPFDGEGSPTSAHALIEDGRLLGFLYDARSARRAGGHDRQRGRGSYRSPPSVGPPTCSWSRARRCSRRCSRAAGDGLYVTDVAGLHSGRQPDLRDVLGGRLGRLIEGGEAGCPVRELTIASDLVSMLRGARRLGSRPAGCRSAAASRRPPILIARWPFGVL